MMLFNTKSVQEKQILSATSSKRERFRKQIRRTNLMVKFQVIRAKLIQQLQSSTLQTTLQSLNQRFNQMEFKDLLNILKGNSHSYQFNENIAKHRLQEILVDLLLKNGNKLTLDQSSNIISALANLTFYSQNSIQSFVSHQPFMDYLRISLQNLQMSKEQSIQYFFQVVSLLMNVASLLKFDFNIFLAESDICNIIISQLNNTSRYCKNGTNSYCKLVQAARDGSLRLFINIVKTVEAQFCQQLAKLIGDILRDQQNLNNHKYRTFLLLAQAIKNDSFWSFFLKDRDIGTFCINICQAMIKVQDRCFSSPFLNNKQDKLTEQQTKIFYSIVVFLNSLKIDLDIQFDAIAWIDMVQNILNGYMLGQFLIEAYHNKNEENLLEALNLFLKLSKTFEVTGQQLIIVRPADDPLQLLKIFTDTTLLSESKAGVFCLQIIHNLLKKEAKFLHAVMEFRILDKISEMLINQALKNRVEILSQIIQLSIMLIQSEKKLEEKKIMVTVMQNKGVIKSIQQLCDHPNRHLYTKAEKFSEIVSEQNKKMI